VLSPLILQEQRCIYANLLVLNTSGLRIAHFSSAYPTARYFKGNIAITAIYNRSLSEEEITQNFNATRHRFNI
jgi:hypothetical protein